MVESTVVRKSGVASSAVMDVAVVSSVRRDLFRDRSKCQPGPRSSTVEYQPQS